MEEIYAMFIPSTINGYIQGFEIFWQSLIQHPLLLVFLIFFIIRKLKHTFFS